MLNKISTFSFFLINIIIIKTTAQLVPSKEDYFKKKTSDQPSKNYNQIKSSSVG